MPTIRERIRRGFQQQTGRFRRRPFGVCLHRLMAPKLRTQGRCRCYSSIGWIAASLAVCLCQPLLRWPVFLISDVPLAASCFKNITFRRAILNCRAARRRTQHIKAYQEPVKLVFLLDLEKEQLARSDDRWYPCQNPQKGFIAAIGPKSQHHHPPLLLWASTFF
jgi:hypothetical protein